MTPEAKVKAKIKAILEKHSAWYAMPIGTGYGNSGTPDFLVCHKGQFIGIEAKATADKQPTALQKRSLQRIETAGGIALVIHIDNLTRLEEVLKQLTTT